MSKWNGVFTALITPFSNGAIDYKSLKTLVDDQIKQGVTGFVINGTTAESPTLTENERDEIFRKTREWTGGKVPLIMGTGSNSTEHTIKNTQAAEKIGADAVLVVVPYYNKPPQRGLYAHFKAVADSTKLPVILYNVPGRTITSLAVETIRDLSKIKNIIGIKEASGNIEFAKDIIKACGPEFVMLSGDDGTYADFLAAGGHGVISVASHILPAEFAKWTSARHNGDSLTALKEIVGFKKVIDALFLEANPIPVKKALQKVNLIQSAELRLPLMELDPAKAEELVKEMRACGVLK